MNHVASIFRRFGGQVALARLIGKRQSTVQYWVSKDRIPAKWQPVLLRLAAERGTPLTANDLVGSGGAETEAQLQPSQPNCIDLSKLPGKFRDSLNRLHATGRYGRTLDATAEILLQGGIRLEVANSKATRSVRSSIR